MLGLVTGMVLLVKLVSSLTGLRLSPWYLALPVALLLGIGRYQLQQPKIDADHIAFYSDGEYEIFVTGMVAQMPDYRDSSTNLLIRALAVDTGEGDYPVNGSVLVHVPANRTYHYGQILRLRGSLQTAPRDAEFSYRDDRIHAYMALAEVTVLPGNRGSIFLKAVYASKEKSLAAIYKILPDPEASLVAGILLGVDTGLPARLQDAFKNTGTSHTVAVSSFNIAVIAAIFFWVFSSILGRWRGTAAAIAAIGFYAILVGPEPAVVRAALIGTLSLFAWQLGGRILAFNTLAATAFIMTLIHPLRLWDSGFQLACFASLGLILYADPLSSLALRVIADLISPDLVQKVIRPISGFVLLPLAAQITTIPIMVYHFKRLSLISFIASLFIMPAQPAVMLFGGLAMFFAQIIQPLGQLAAWIVWPFAAYTIRVVEMLNIPNGTIYLGNLSILITFVFYAVLLSLTFSRPRLSEWLATRSARLQAIALVASLVVLFICTMLTWRAAFNTGDGRLHITFLEVGSASGILVQTPAGRNVLINGGSSASELSDELGRRLPLFNRKLDWLVIASTREDELSALPRAVDRYTPQNVLWSGNMQASQSAELLDEYFAEAGIPVTRAEVGQRLDLGEGAYLEVQAEGPRGSVLIIRWNDFTAALPIGISEGTLEELEFGNVIGRVDVLLLADSGFAPANPPDLIQNLNPRLVVLSVSAGDPDGMPPQETLDNLEGYSLLRTDRNGWIDVSTAGKEMRVQVERGAVSQNE